MNEPSVLPHDPPRQSTGLQSTGDIQTMNQRPATTFRPIPYWVKFDPAVDPMNGRSDPHILKFAEAVRERLRRAGKEHIALRGIERLRSEYAKQQGMDPCDSLQFQLFEESKPLSKEYATPNPENVAHLPELSSQQEQAKLQEGFFSSNNASQEFIKSDYTMVKPLPDDKEIKANGLRYMNHEAFAAFNYYIAENDLDEVLDYKFGELLHHCFTFEEYGKVYTHYNFTMEMKKKDEQYWTSKLCFAEVKRMRGVKFYFCSPLEATDGGKCYSCMDQGINELKHPSGGGYEKGQEGNTSRCGYACGSDDEECV